MLSRFFIYITQVFFYSIYSICCITKPNSFINFPHLLLNFIFQDYSVTYGHCPEITVYTSCCYFPSAAQLPSLWAENKKSLLSMLVEVSLSLLPRSKLPGICSMKSFIKAFSYSFTKRIYYLF